MLTTAITGVLVSLLTWMGVENALYYAPALWMVIKVLVVVAGVGVAWRKMRHTPAAQTASSADASQNATEAAPAGSAPGVEKP